VTGKEPPYYKPGTTVLNVFATRFVFGAIVGFLVGLTQDRRATFLACVVIGFLLAMLGPGPLWLRE
jgi:uncharacterized membrane protein